MSAWTYRNSRGKVRRLTEVQHRYLQEAAWAGSLERSSRFPSTMTARALQENGLVRMTQRPSGWTITAVTDIGRDVLDAVAAEAAA